MNKKYFLASLNIALLILLFLIFIIGLYQIKYISNFKSITLTCFMISIIILSIYLYLNKNIKLYNIGIFITFLLNVTLCYSIYDLNQKYDYISNIIEKKYQYNTYNVYVQKKNVIYSDIEKLNGKKIGTLSNTQNISLLLNSKIKIECKKYNNVDELIYAIENGEIQSIILTNSQYNLLQEETDINDKLRNIYSVKIKENI